MEVWEARRLDHVIEAGRTFPLVVDCAGPGPESRPRRLFVVKALGLPEVTVDALAFETIGNVLAGRLGINTPVPVLVRMGSDFVEAVNPALTLAPVLADKGTRLVAGVGAGCEFLSPGFSPLVAGASVGDSDLEQALRIYTFDMIAQNPDRSFGPGTRPNCAYFKDRLVAFDFELCFSFVRLVGTSCEPWEVCAHGLYRHHAFYHQLCDAVRTGKVDFSAVLLDIGALDVADLLDTMESLPEGWSGFSDRIGRHLSEIVANTHSLELELYRSLAS